jgi:N-methylhydantoinase A/oxoprolinase/acetone carboxylase beta subunit
LARILQAGCDIGTFTDFVLVNDQAGRFYVHKCLTTPADPSMPWSKACGPAGDPRGETDIDEIIHGTTW